MKSRKQVVSQHAVGKQAGGAWGRVILLSKPSRYLKVKLCNHRMLNGRFTVPGVSQKRAVRAECFLFLDSVLGWRGKIRCHDLTSCQPGHGSDKAGFWFPVWKCSGTLVGNYTFSVWLHWIIATKKPYKGSLRLCAWRKWRITWLQFPPFKNVPKFQAAGLPPVEGKTMPPALQLVCCYTVCMLQLTCTCQG